jgi:two-component system LytT family response regulator
VADPETPVDRLVLRDGRRTLYIPVSEIDWVEAAGNYVQIYTARRTHLVRHTVKAMEDKLDPRRFVRVRPSAIVSVGAVAELNARVGGDYLVVLADNTEIRSSRGYRDRVESALANAPGTARQLWAGRQRRRAAARARADRNEPQTERDDGGAGPTRLRPASAAFTSSVA